LEDVLGQLVERAREVLDTEGGLRRLVAANQTIISGLALPKVLRHIVTAACQLVRAQYGALGVLAPAGNGLDEFVYVGFDERTAASIGHPPEGKGLLGALIDEPRPVRLERLADDPRSIGFPPGHPPMSAFLGVPIRVRGELFGNLYLTEPASGRFTADDEELALAVAATAGIAIENARLYERAERGQEWLSASAEITRQLLTATGDEPLALIADKVRQVADADLATVVLPDEGRTRIRVEVASGRGSDEVTGMVEQLAGTLADLAFNTGHPAAVENAAESPRPVHLSQVIAAGPVMVLPMVGSAGVRGALCVARLAGRRPFDEAELGMGMTFATHAALSLELADAREDQQQMLLMQDRERIARDLHDHVIQRLFATGLTAQGAAAASASAEQSARLSRVVADIDETIDQIRTTIFQLRGALLDHPASVRRRVLDVAAAGAPLLGFKPRVRFHGPLDLAVSEDLAADLLAVLREAISNAARHAGARRVELALSAADNELVVEVVDDGRGLGASTRRSGLANLARRAQRHGGTFEVSAAGFDVVGDLSADQTVGDRPGDASTTAGPAARPGPGTRLRWAVPLT